MHNNEPDKLKMYRKWKNMKNKCLNPNYSCYGEYGGRGITINKEWLGKNGFENFIKDMGYPPDWKMPLGRIDNNLNFYKENCEWAIRRTKKREDLTGQKFSRLLVLEYSHHNSRRKVFWKCRCENDGNIVIVSSYELKCGNTKSCGCFSREMTTKRCTKHNMCETRVYAIHEAMKGRCLNKNSKHYKDYGGRGITICPRWLDKERGFLNFLEDMGEPPEGMSIDRINNDGNYEPENCRWATQTQQMQNTRQNVNLTYNGETRCVSEWAKILNITPGSLSQRLRKGWPIEKVLGPKTNEKYIFYKEKNHTIKEISNIINISCETIRSRLSAGWSIDKIVNTPVEKHKETIKISFNNRLYTVKEISKETGIEIGTIKNRIKTGWPIEKIFSSLKYRTDGTTVSSNETVNVNLTHNGETHCISEWSKILNIGNSTISSRLKRGCSVEDALSNGDNKKIMFNNQLYTIREISKITGLSYSTIRTRIKSNQPIEMIFSPLKFTKNGKPVKQ